jgi:N-acetylmuramoyl-L-alanine amidase
MATRPLSLIVIHCSATPNGRWTRAADIDHWHQQRGFARQAAARARFNPDLGAIGYHWVIYPNGALASGRHVDEVGAHVAGWNAGSIGLCLVGTDRYTTEQWAQLADQVRHLARQHDIPLAFADVARLGKAARGICGHRDLSPDRNGNGVVEPSEWLKTCPGFSVRDWLASGMQAPHSVLPPTTREAR